MKRWLLLAVVAGVISGVLGEPLRARYKEVELLPAVPDAKAVKQWGIGLGPAVAMGYWLQTLSTVGGWMVEQRNGHTILKDDIFNAPERARWLEATLNAIIELEPRFPEPYLYGGIILYWYAKEHAVAMRFLERGFEAHIPKWEIPYYLGYFHYRAEEFDAAMRWYRASSLYPDAPAVAPLMTTLAAGRAGNPEAGLALLDMLLISLPPKMEQFRVLIEADRKQQARLVALNRGLKQYRAKYGKAPATPEELVETGFASQDDLVPPSPGFFKIENDAILFVPQM